MSAVAVAENVQEDFSKPPPKKKWLQNYIEEDSQSPVGLGTHLREETQQFVKLLGRQTSNKTEGLNQWAAANTPHKLTLSQDVIGGVVQGVIDQFQNFFENDAEGGGEEGEAEAEQEPEQEAEQKPEQKLSQTEITPVVQSVISQFLNGSLSDSGFRRSRKRSHKHVNSRSKDKSAGSGASAAAANVRNSSVIQFKGATVSSSDVYQNKIKVRKIETLLSCPSQPKPSYVEEEQEESSEALNLSCPKSNTTKVTFANEDKCYSIDSVKSFQESKSRKMFSLDYSRRIHENLQLIVAEDEEDGDDVPLDLADKSRKLVSLPDRATPVICFRGSPPAPAPARDNMFSQPPGPPLQLAQFSSAPVSRQPSPLDKAAFPISKISKAVSVSGADPRFSPSDLTNTPLAIIKPKPIKPTLDEAAPKQAPNLMLRELFSSKPGHSTFLQTQDTFKPKPALVPAPAPVPAPASVPVSKSPVSEVAGPGQARQTTREVHNRLEKNRRAHLKSCFNDLATECELEAGKASNLLVIRTAYKAIMALRREEREQERTLAALVQEKVRRQSYLNELRRETSGYCHTSDSE